MRQFTIKDIIKYNSPCKICEAKTEFYFKTIPSESYSENGLRINPIVNKGLLSFTISNKYKSKLLMVVNPVTNKFTLQSNAKDAIKFFEGFQETNYLFAESSCKKCGTLITSDSFEFDGNNIKPIKLFTETVLLQDMTHNFILSTSFTNNKTFISINLLNKSKNPFIQEFNALPLYKFKNKEEILKKLKVILAFS